MIDIFVSTLCNNGIRGSLCEAVRQRFIAEKICDYHIFSPLHGNPSFRIPAERMQRERRIRADELAKSDIYIVADDDCMPIGPDFIARGVAVMEAHPDFAVLAARNCHEKNDEPPYVGRYIDDDVWEAHAVGGIRFCRKGAVKHWPESVSAGSYDCQHHEGIVASGMRAGYMRRVTMNHLGIGLSTHWPEVPEITLYD